MRFTVVFASAVATLLSSAPLQALEGYPSGVSDQFMSWCSRAQNQPPTVCSCAIDKATLEIPASAMASFLGSAEGGGVTSMSTSVGATAVSIIASCAAAGGGTGTTGGTSLKSLGTSLGQ